MTRPTAGRNLRDLRVAEALPGRALGGGPGPRGRARGEPEPGGPGGRVGTGAGGARAGARSPVDAAGWRGPPTKPRGGLVLAPNCPARKMCAEPLCDTALA